MKRNGSFAGALCVLTALGTALFATACTSSLKTHVEGNAPYVDIVGKDFETKGMIFVETSVKRDTNGETITYDLLLKEAQNLGGEAIVNVAIDKKETKTRFLWWLLDTETTWIGSALAIKYIN
ncbi:MAG: hypothetical protein LBD71_04995 [Treponema sp.]|jgi:hypothetical protein|nr:hypothetical protein [Treponema sp.]